jgi:hypothetical protein
MRVIRIHTADTTKNPARIGQPAEVELSLNEQACKDRFDAAVEDGKPPLDAAMQALAGMFPSARTPEFVHWLSDGTVRLTVDKRVVRTSESRRPRGGPIMSAEQIMSKAKE